jgi:hypothetical protein
MTNVVKQLRMTCTWNLPALAEVALTLFGDEIEPEAVSGAKKNLPTLFYNRSVILPLAQQTAGCKRCHISGGGQLFVCSIERESLGNLLANSLGEADQHACEPLTRSLTDQGHVICHVPRQIVVCDKRCIFEQQRKAACQTAKSDAVPYQHRAVLYCFRTDQIRCRRRQESRATEYLSRRQPKKNDFVPILRVEEKPGSPFGHQKQVACCIPLADDHRVGREVPLLGRC